MVVGCVKRAWRVWVEAAAIVGSASGAALALMLAGCAAVVPASPPAAPPPDVPQSPRPAVAVPMPATGGSLSPEDAVPTGSAPPPRMAKSRWTAVPWSELPGLDADALHEAWNAWLKSCERAAPAWLALCPQVRRLSIAGADEQRAWMLSKLQPYRIEPLGPTPNANASASTSASASASASAEGGLLTAYFEPVLDARRQPDAAHTVPLHRPPATLGQRKPWYSRQEIDTLPEAQAALRGREIAYLTDPVDALLLQIQGSGRLRLTEPDGRISLVRVAYAGTNDHPYRSVGGWLLQQGAVRDASWPGIRAWVQANPQRVQQMLWSNPRTVFFREERLTDFDAAFGPRGAQGVPLTPGRSIAVDPQSIPYGTPVWLASPGPTLPLARLVLAQDTGSAIVGAVRADYFMGSGAAAGEVAGRLKQPLRLWALWPRSGP